MHRSTPSQSKRSRSPFSASRRRRWDDREGSGSSLTVENEDYSRYLPREFRASVSRRGMAYGHIDTFGVDDSEEEGAGPVERLPVRGKTGKLKDDKVYDQEKGARSNVMGAHAHFSSYNRNGREERDPAPSGRYSAGRAEYQKQNGAASYMSSAEGKGAKKGDNLERERRGQSLPVHPGRAPVSLCGGGKNTSKSAEEPVVRPKVRNVAPPSVKPKVFFDTDDDDDMPHSTSRWMDAAKKDESYPNGMARRGRGESSSSYSEPKYPEDKREGRITGQGKREKGPRRRRTMADSNFYMYNDYHRYMDEDSDSEKEWIATLRCRYRNRELPPSPSGESWETLTGKEEQEPPQASLNVSAASSSSPDPEDGACAMAGASAGASASASASTSDSTSASTGASTNGNSYIEDVQEPSLRREEQAPRGAAEIPWLRYSENESSSEGDNNSRPPLIQPGTFVLDGNNNLEDDSSVSEDLEVDWSLFDGFADGLGVAEAISYVDPQFLTYMALEERLAQAMETALAHLESLAVDVEVANPPANKESIDTLPEILVTEDQDAVGQEMCCPICCSEYVKGEVATELPCHHYFHKPCVSIWLQKSGTCPVCRCMFPPAL
ncbi:E3 ubiquitin-protein ligase Praja-1 [Dipodomys spectabilis]|uniref:E3 ubiquitin-protein ligase Praja-1 n=1 Tax=Dipodomys spectabilis TaxID=105255 RepID=UPI001C53BED7|nr:E3 ubiquitin-protein ligase Praja-1 [Dipodomys spectabilis]XP_042550856.1 E3 ubiquitin-protein ligase Praja-1 [Dipodomys spectabilis]